MRDARAAERVRLARQPPRLPDTAKRLADGTLPAGYAGAITDAVARLDDIDTRLGERLLLDLTEQGHSAGQVAKNAAQITDLINQHRGKDKEPEDSKRGFSRSWLTKTKSLDAGSRTGNQAEKNTGHTTHTSGHTDGHTDNDTSEHTEKSTGHGHDRDRDRDRNKNPRSAADHHPAKDQQANDLANTGNTDGHQTPEDLTEKCAFNDIRHATTNHDPGQATRPGNRPADPPDDVTAGPDDQSNSGPRDSSHQPRPPDPSHGLPPDLQNTRQHITDTTDDAARRGRP